MPVPAAVFFQHAYEHAKLEDARLSAQLSLWGWIRFGAFVLAVLFATGVMGVPNPYRWVLVLLSIVGFGTSVLMYRRREVARDRARAQATLAAAQLESISGNHDQWEAGEAFMDPGHAFAADLDVFGPHSVFRMLNRTFLDEGRRLLAARLTQWQTDPKEILRQQRAVKALGQDLEWCLELITDTNLAAGTQSSTDQLKRWAASGNAQQRRGVYRILHMAIPVYSLTIILCGVLGVLSGGLTSILVLLPLAFVSAHLARTQEVSAQLGKQHAALLGLSGVLDRLAEAPEDGEVLADLRQQSQGAGDALRKLSSIANAFDNRHNLLVAVVFNLLAGWDFWCLKRLEEWHGEHGSHMDTWLGALAQGEVLTSLGLFAASQPGLTWPTPTNEGMVQTRGLGHPMLNPEVRVCNDFGLDQNGFSIVTGANMAGKSTFLRTLGVNLVLAQMGAPVVAQSFTFRPVPLFSSMRTTDALEDNASYFYAELRRLQILVEHLESGQELFVILDEILKGTNSKDKAEGSRKFLEKLTRLPASGVIATHDLSLCVVADSSPQVHNQFFDVTIGTEDLDFDYVLRDGVCANMNATFLMDKMGITK